MRSKFFHIILLLALSFVCLNTKAQVNLQQKISINVQNMPVNEVLTIIELEHNYFFAYNPEFLPAKNISISLEDTPLKQVLNKILESKFSYKIVGDHIILNPKTRQSVTKKSFTITGTVSNRDNIPIDSVIIYAVNDKKAVITDQNGFYSLELEKQPQYINISHPYFRDTLILAESLIEGITIHLQPIFQPDTENIEKLETRLPVLESEEVRFEDIKFVKRFVSQDAIYVANQIRVREYMPAQISLIPGIGSNSLISGLQKNILSLNIIAGYSSGLLGLEAGGVANIIQEDVIGMQAAGVTNIVNGSTYGAQFAGVLNYNFGYLKGIQASGVGNISRNVSYGIQAAGVFNYNKGGIVGLQVSGITNVNRGAVKGMQVGGVYNYAPETMGIQISSVLNTTWHELKGAQISGVSNYAALVKGVQISSVLNMSAGDVTGVQISSLLNKAKALNGLQFGLINIADSVETGLQVGLFNFVKNGYRAFEFTSNETYPFDFLYKTGGKKLYSSLNVGVDNNEVGFGYGIGIVQPIFNNVSISIDGISTVMLQTNSPETYLGQKSSFRLAVNYDFIKQLGITTGVSFNKFKPYDNITNNTTENTLSFTSNSNDIISQSRLSGQKSSWIGWFVGIRI